MLLLDNDATICAQSTPASLYKYILDELQVAFKTIDSIKDTEGHVMVSEQCYIRPLNKLLIADILYSKANRDWLVEYYNALALLQARYFKVKYPPINCDYRPFSNIGEYYGRQFRLHAPVYDNKYISLVKENEDFYKAIDDLVELSRLMLMQLEPTEDEFPAGVPIWLEEVQQNAYVAFDPISKVHVKVVKQDDNYRYFIAHISNNWKEIHNVPPEMKLIIDCLIKN